MNDAVDVCILTWDSEDKLEECVTSIYHEIPVNRLIVVDRYSTDDTLNILVNYPDVHLHQKDYNIPEARSFAIRQVETPFFCFVDADVVLLEGWFKLSRVFKDEAVGAVHGLWDYGWGGEGQQYRVASRTLSGWLNRTAFRAFLGDTILKTEAVRDVAIPRELVVFEDQYLRRILEQRGYRWTWGRDRVYALHYMRHHSHRDASELGRCARLSGEYDTGKALRYVAASLGKAVYTFLFHGRDPLIIPRRVKGSFRFLKGVVEERRVLQ